jgi:tRNA-2-methylthio-N6-dimethylallyladenosine synthase
VAINYRDEWEVLPAGFDSTADGKVSVFVTISRGCNKNCTYCIVPTTRGKEVSRDLNEILREVRLAVHRGAKEVTLLGQTVNSYGLDFSPRLGFAHLLDKVSEVEGLERIRFFSPHPQEIREDFFDLVERNPKVCRHIHMPLQSGSDSILKAMNRNYRSKRYLEIIDELRRRVPDIAITTDIIVGFPGETEEDFKRTLDVMEIVQYDNSYSFLFSARPGTVAEGLVDTISAEEKMARLKILQVRQAEITVNRLDGWIGKKAQVLVDGPSYIDPTKVKGRMSQNMYVNLTEVTPDLRPGMFVDVEITGRGRNTLKGKPLTSGARLAQASKIA